MANMKVTPTRIMKRLKGKPATTLLALMSMKTAPTMIAKAMLSRPT